VVEQHGQNLMSQPGLYSAVAMLALAEKERDFIRSRQTGKKKGVYRGRKPSVPVDPRYPTCAEWKSPAGGAATRFRPGSSGGRQ